MSKVVKRRWSSTLSGSGLPLGETLDRATTNRMFPIFSSDVASCWMARSRPTSLMPRAQSSD